MAEQRLIGKAFVGTVTTAETDRVEGIGRSRRLRPLITVRTEDPVQLIQGEDTVFDQARPKQKALVRSLVELPLHQHRSRHPPTCSATVQPFRLGNSLVTARMYLRACAQRWCGCPAHVDRDRRQHRTPQHPGEQ
jgi:hypothetical protein